MNFDFSNVTDWLAANPEVLVSTALFLIYWARSIMPRVPPVDPFWYKVWEIETKLLAMPWDRWFGKLQLPGKIVPPNK